MISPPLTDMDMMDRLLCWIRYISCVFWEFFTPVTPKIIRYECPLCPQERRQKAALSIKQRQGIILEYDPLHCESLNNFQPLKNKSDCIFAKSAILWGSQSYDTTKTLEDNISNSIPAITKFMSLVEEQPLDGFLIEVVGQQYGKSVDAFAVTVRRVLTAISRHDPSGLNCMNMKSITTSSWYFSFGGVPIFVTSFAPCYPSSHCRYMHLSTYFAADEDAPHGSQHGHNKDQSCYILLQPEESFLRRGIGADTPHTEWKDPRSARDKIRLKFLESGRAYHIPETTRYAVANTFVLPHDCALRGDGVRFWDTEKYPDSLHNS